MRSLVLLPGALIACCALADAAWGRQVVEASAPEAVSVTVYRDPERGDADMQLSWLNGFALVSETRNVTLPPGETTIRFDSVAESMVAVSAIVTGLPGGTIEKNRNAEILSPAALVDGTLGNRVTVTRTNPATGAEASESAIVRTRADGGLVLETRDGYEAVRCAGIPEKLSFGKVPDGLSPGPVYTVDTRSVTGGTYTIRLTYLASGFDWNAHYVATFARSGLERARKLHVAAWLTIANGNGQSFADAELLAVAGKLEVQSDYRGLSRPPSGRPLRLTCYPIGSTAQGMPVPSGNYPAPPPAAMMARDGIVVTAQRKMADEVMEMAAPLAVVAGEESLGDLKLYRVPVPVTVAGKAQKQVAFLNLQEVEGRLVHRASCLPQMAGEEWIADIVLRSRNLDRNGLGRALPAGGVTVFEPGAYGPLLLSEDWIDDYAVGQDVEIGISNTSQITLTCNAKGMDDRDKFDPGDGKWHTLEAVIDNGSDERADVEVRIGGAANWAVRRASRKIEAQDGVQVLRLSVPARAKRTLRWQVRNPSRAEAEQDS